MSTSFREPEPIKPDVPAREPDKFSREDSPEDFRPVENDQDLLEVLGVADDIKILPSEDREDLQELKDYLNSYLEEKGLPKTIRGMRKGIESLKEDVGLHKDADPQAVIKKIGGIARSWKELSFVQDFHERKQILIKLVESSSQREMDKIIFEEMEKIKAWRQ